jgi:hypothetical protein
VDPNSPENMDSESYQIFLIDNDPTQQALSMNFGLTDLKFNTARKWGHALGPTICILHGKKSKNF